MRPCLLSVVPVILILLISAVADAGVVMQKVRYQEGVSGKQNGELLISGNKIRINDIDSNVSSIIDLNSGEYIIMDHENKNYTRTDIEHFLNEAERFTESMHNSVERHLYSLPPEQEKHVRELLRQNEFIGEKKNRSSVRIRKVDDRTRISGMHTVKYQIFLDNRLVEEVWLLNGEQLGGELDLEKMSELMKKYRVLNKKISTREISNSEQYSNLFSKGFPLKTADHFFGSSVFVEEVTDLSFRDLDSSHFTVDPSYNKKPLSSLFE